MGTGKKGTNSMGTSKKGISSMARVRVKRAQAVWVLEKKA